MIRIYFDNKEFLEIENIQFEQFLETIEKLSQKYSRNKNLITFNNKYVIDFDKVVYVEKMEENDENI